MSLRLALMAVILLGGAAAGAQAIEVPAPSPLARVEQRVGVTAMSVEYSSPAVKGRAVWGGLVPFDQLWRAGANASTKLTSSTSFTFGGKVVPAGTYALFAIPKKDQWTVVLNSHHTGSGTAGYEEKNDVARVTAKPMAAPMRERLTFLFSDTTDEGTRLDLEWEKVRVSVPIKVDTKGLVAAQIDKTLADAWRPHFTAARWLLESGGNLDEALTHVETSVAIKSTWWNQWVKAQVLGKKGRVPEAVAAAEKAQELGKDDRIYGFFKDEIAKTLAGWKKTKS